MNRYELGLDSVPIAKWGATVMLYEETIMNRQLG